MSHYRNCIEKITCSPQTPACFFRTCSKCSDVNVLSSFLLSRFEENDIAEDDVITFKQWMTTNRRSSLEDISKPVDEFVQFFTEKIVKLASHSFISSQQSQFFKYRKEHLQSGEFFVSCDFSENYSFLIQDAVQGYYWNNQQATIHPIVVYFKNEMNELEHWSYIIISESLDHDAAAIYLFISKLIKKMKDKFPLIKKLIYMTDGTGAQYKNLNNFINLYMHRFDYGIEAEWHFHATSHGKGPCDGIGGTLKRQASHVSLTRPLENQITSPKLLYDWAVSAKMMGDVEYATVIEHETTKKQLEDRFSYARTIKGTQKYHCFIPHDNGNMKLKRFSLDEDFEIVKFI